MSVIATDAFTRSFRSDLTSVMDSNHIAILRVFIYFYKLSSYSYSRANDISKKLCERVQKRTKNTSTKFLTNLIIDGV